jgi:hypothetical protein
MKIRTACLLLLSAWTLSACAFLLPEEWKHRSGYAGGIPSMDYGYDGAHVSPDFRDPPPPPPPPQQ